MEHYSSTLTKGANSFISDRDHVNKPPYKKNLPAKACFVISYPPHWGKLKIDFILLRLYLPSELLFSQGCCESEWAPQFSQPGVQAASRSVSHLTSWHHQQKYSRPGVWSVQDYGIPISQILFVMDVLPGVDTSAPISRWKTYLAVVKKLYRPFVDILWCAADDWIENESF